MSADLGTLAEIAARLDGRVQGDATLRIAGIASIEDAAPAMLTFATDARYLHRALESKATAILTEDAALNGLSQEELARRGKPLVVVASARVGLARLLHSYQRPRPAGTHVDPAAAIDASASLGPDAIVGARAVVGARARIGARATLGAGCIIGADARIGDDAVIHPGALFLDRCVAGDRLTLQAGAVVGSDGFGYVFVDGAYLKIPQVGNVVLGDDVEIGANTCIDRAQTGATTIGDGTKIDNLVQVGHNCRIGKNAAFAAFCGLAGSTDIGDYTRAGGMAGFKGHITVGARVTIAGHAMVWKDVPDDAFFSGDPAQDH
ncbi:MAG: UDP-3-O-(3-hydroxymyristoyl)glucosamine N-acyltransferase, partial [Candidatus Eremiobacteraeota bacterium]|nr:UDP-3-O-(3-hydroxymyristoyl)glucosamine N-acyltransferase [Candidatus Eremiobacteraeota bacterium]